MGQTARGFTCIQRNLEGQLFYGCWSAWKESRSCPYGQAVIQFAALILAG